MDVNNVEHDGRSNFLTEGAVHDHHTETIPY